MKKTGKSAMPLFSHDRREHQRVDAHHQRAGSAATRGCRAPSPCSEPAGPGRRTSARARGLRATRGEIPSRCRVRGRCLAPCGWRASRRPCRLLLWTREPRPASRARRAARSGGVGGGPGIRYGELACSAARRRARGHAGGARGRGRRGLVGRSSLVWRRATPPSCSGRATPISAGGRALASRTISRSSSTAMRPGSSRRSPCNDDPGMFPGFLGRTGRAARARRPFLVANAPQRLYTLGLLSAAGRLNPTTYDDPPLHRDPVRRAPEPPGAVRTGRPRRARARGRRAGALVRRRVSLVRLRDRRARLRARARARPERLVRDRRWPPSARARA